MRIVTRLEADSTVKARARQGVSTPTNGVRIWPMKPARGRGMAGVRSSSATPTRIGPAGLIRGEASRRSSARRWYWLPTNDESSTGHGPTTISEAVKVIASRLAHRLVREGARCGPSPRIVESAMS